MLNCVGKKEKKKKKNVASHIVGLEPTTFRLTAERANRLRHTCLLRSKLRNYRYYVFVTMFYQKPLKTKNWFSSRLEQETNKISVSWWGNNLPSIITYRQLKNEFKHIWGKQTRLIFTYL